MTSEELRIVQVVLRDSARLSNRDADALVVEIARRCSTLTPRSVTKLDLTPEPCEEHGKPYCDCDK